MKKIKNFFTKKNIIIISITLGIILVCLGVYSLFVPRMNLKGNNEITLTVNSKYIEKGATVNSIIKINDEKIKISGNVDTTKIGEYEIVYKTKNLFLNKEIKRKIKIVDKEKPIITLNGNVETSVCTNTEYTEEGYTATDNYDGDITSKVKIVKDKDYIKYYVTDSSKNSFNIKRIIKHEDVIGPIIKLNGDTTYLLVGNKYNENGYSAIDNCDGDITNKVSITGNVDTNKIGTYKLTYSITDSSNNTSSIERKVIVYKPKQKTTNPVSPNGAVIYLTFDDGPSSSITPGILNILKEEGVKATFFVIGKSSGLDYLIKREHDEGHAIGIHGNSHDYATIYSSENAFFNNINTLRDKIYNLTGEYSNIIRFPGGSSNTVSKKYNVGIMSRLTTQVMEKGFVYFDWNVGSNDTNKISSNQIVNNVLNGVSPSKVNVVLMHDFENNYKTLNALKSIIQEGKNRGYTFDKITTSTPQVKHGVQN